MAKPIHIPSLSLTSSGWQDYELCDSGRSQKLERFGDIRLVRFEPEAVWKPALPLSDWQQAHAVFTIEKGSPTGTWRYLQEVPDGWQIGLQGLTIQLRIRNSRHVGIFPEQIENWNWIENKIKSAGREIRVLNLFGYTGIASLFAARAGAEVTHVDAARSAVKWAQANQELSSLEALPIRWIVDDAFKFVEREIRRGVQYDAIILDPPKFGRGPKGETWNFEQAVSDLLSLCRQVLSDNPLFICLTAYDVHNSPAELGSWATGMMTGYHGQVECGDLIQLEKSAGRKIKQSMFARWSPYN